MDAPAPRNRTLYLTDADRGRALPPLPDGPVPEGLWWGDGLQALRRVPPADLIVADPPYDAPEDWQGAWIAEAARALRPGGSIYVCCDWALSGRVHAHLARHLTVRNRITWKRDKGRGAKRNWKQNMEDVWFATKGDDYVFNLVKWRKKVIAPYRVDGKPKDWVEEDGERFRMTHPSNIWTDLCVPFWSMPENTPHPFQKPEKLVERIVEASSRPADLVIDPFAGSGTTAVVARRLGRRFIAVEQDPEWARLALKRLAERP